MNKGIKSYFLTAILAGAAAMSLASCNSDETWGSDPQDLSGTAVTGFSLRSDAQVLNNLDSVFFSIDLVECKIFNANPLPYDTDISALGVNIASDQCSVAQLFVEASADAEAQVIDYLTAPETKINFSRGPVRLHLVSADGQNQRDYEIKVNVASVVADSLYWDEMQGGKLVGVAGMIRNKTVKVGDKALMLSVGSRGATAISTFTPNAKSGGGNWDANLITPVFTDVNTMDYGLSLNVASFTATDNGDLYILDTYNHLMRSTDGGKNFSIVENGWLSISIPYLDGVIGLRDNAGSFAYAAYPASIWEQTSGNVPADFPLSGISSAASFSSKWASKPQSVIVGGTTVSGATTGAAWAFDGNKWARISNKLPAATGYALGKYIIAETDTTSWNTTQREVLIAFGGKTLRPTKEVWISRDMGVNWQKGSSLLQLPKYIPFSTGASLLVFDKRLDLSDATPMAVKPITSWDCPYLYLFGGYNESGLLNNDYWSGVVNHLRFKPLQ